MENLLIKLLLGIPAFFCILLILKQPYIGLVVIVASLPIIDIFPDVPFASSIFPLVGGLTIGAQVFSSLRAKDRSDPGSREIFLLSTIFVVWLFISNPYVAIQPNAEGRNWLFTFLQLVILVWMASHAMDKPYKHYILFAVYSLATATSAIYAIYNGGVADTIEDSIRSAGLAGGANSAARYFLVALVFLYFLQSRQTNKVIRLMLFVVMGVIILGTLVTVSRTGILLLVAAIGMLIALERRHSKPQVLALVLLSITIVWFFADNILAISRSILPSIQTGSDTVGVRYGLWKAGIGMLESHPISGVGIGQFPVQLPFYGRELLRTKYLNRGAHNMYIQIAAETGLVGFLLFTSLLILSLRIFWKSQKLNDKDVATIGKSWLVAFVLILIGGVTKHDHYDKLLWFMIGISACPMWTKTIYEQIVSKTPLHSERGFGAVAMSRAFEIGRTPLSSRWRV